MLVPNRSHPSRTSKRLFAVAAVAVIALAACGDDDDSATATTAPAAAAATTVPAAAPATTAAGAYDRGSATATTAAAAGAAGAVMVADSSLGKILTDANGMTLYLFMPDNAGAPTCTDACAQSWPPFTVDSGAPTGGDGVDASMLGTATHPAAGTQVTYNGWPLYHFKGDSKAGDTNGQGQGDIWYAVSPAGEAIDND